MFGFSLGHMIIVLVVLLLFNARKLPELGSALGKGLNAFKKGLDGKSNDEDPSLLKDQNDTDRKDT